jgi:CubicO group peptidase (beta-lactamase class C family)
MGSRRRWQTLTARMSAASGFSWALGEEALRSRATISLALGASLIMLAACSGGAALSTGQAVQAALSGSSPAAPATALMPLSTETRAPTLTGMASPTASRSPTPPPSLPAGPTVLRPMGTPTSTPTVLPTPTPIPLVTVEANLPASPPLPTAWPVDGWPTSTPEEVGVDSGILADMFKYLPRDPSLGHGLMGLLAIRHGYLFLEAYFYPYHGDIPGDIFSCTKSVTSILVGIAVAQGALEGVNQPVLELFPDRPIQNVDARKEAMTLEDLLTMKSGLDWEELRAGYSDVSSPFQQWLRRDDQVQYVLDRPMVAEPGTWFEYNTGVSHLLSAIVQESTGTPTLDFAQHYLFGPLGITDVIWQQDPEGIYTGGYGLQLTARDMAKLGYLYLRQGEWNGEQIVPAEWVEASTTTHTLLHHYFPNRDIGYGYQWWIFPALHERASEIIAAQGLMGQYIFIVPRKDIVVVITGWDVRPADQATPDSALWYLQRFVLYGAKSEGPLPPNPNELARLQAEIEAAARPPESGR